MNEDTFLELNYRKPFNIINKWAKQVNNARQEEHFHRRLFECYTENMLAYVSKSKIKDPFTGIEMEPDEKLMRSVEKEAGIKEESRVDDFRRQTAAYIGTMIQKNIKPTWDCNPHLRKGITKKIAKDLR